MPRSRNLRKSFGRKTYSIIVDGETEIWYLQMMKKHEDLPKIDIKPELPKRKKLKEQYESVVENAKDYDKVIWIIDFDTIIKEDRERRKGQKSKIIEFKQYSAKLKKNFTNVEVLVNTPCLEYWFLLHCKTTSCYYSECENAGKEIKKNSLLKSYEKTEKFYKKNNNDIYSLLKDYQAFAKSNADKLGRFDFDNPHSAKAEIHKLLDFLGI